MSCHLPRPRSERGAPSPQPASRVLVVTGPLFLPPQGPPSLRGALLSAACPTAPPSGHPLFLPCAFLEEATTSAIFCSHPVTLLQMVLMSGLSRASSGPFQQGWWKPVV